MAFYRNRGMAPDEILQNQFTAYLLSAVQRRRWAYINVRIRDCEVSSLNEKIYKDEKFDLEREELKSVPLMMKLKNEKLYQALSELSEREQYVFFSRVLDETSFEELASELSLSYKGVAAIYYRTIEKMKKKIKGGRK